MMTGDFLNLIAANGDKIDAQVIFAFVLISIGLIGGIVAPFLTRTRVKATAAHVAGWILWFLFALIASQFVVVPLIMILGEQVAVRVEITAIVEVLTYFIAFAIMVSLPWRRWKNRQNHVKKNQQKPIANKIDTRQFILKLSGLQRKPSWDDVKKFLTFILLYFGTLIVVNSVLTSLVGPEVMEQEQDIGFNKTGQGPLSLTLIFFCLVILAPLFEEMLVRGALFSKLRDRLKFWPTALFTASIFALIHGQFNVGVMTFILAMYAAYLRERTGAIWSGIMLHASQNLLAFYLLFFG